MTLFAGFSLKRWVILCVQARLRKRPTEITIKIFLPGSQSFIFAAKAWGKILAVLFKRRLGIQETREGSG
ncbi:MAG: hypothetical protein CBC67_04085 [Gammaproteobacteria bacterium TMED107]|nr:hypothetical protein [Gammaproteobacteria bacterium]OUX75694.1 MAG: hypothetical protein CBC67_04085 [Gammaproteobacteria bacterium TMED107]